MTVAMTHLAISLSRLVSPRTVVSPRTSPWVVPPTAGSCEGLGEGVGDGDGSELGEGEGLGDSLGEGDGEGLGDASWANTGPVEIKSVQKREMATAVFFIGCLY